MSSWLTIIDGRAQFVNLSSAGVAHVWSPTRLSVPTKTPHSQALVTASHVNGSVLAVGHDEGSVFVYNLANRTKAFLSVGSGKVCALHASESKIFVATVDGVLYQASHLQGSDWSEAKRVASELGVVTAIDVYKNNIYVAVKNGSRIISLDMSSGGIHHSIIHH